MFDLYMSYIINFPMMFEKLTKITQNSERFRQFLQVYKHDPRIFRRQNILVHTHHTHTREKTLIYIYTDTHARAHCQVAI